MDVYQVRGLRVNPQQRIQVEAELKNVHKGDKKTSLRSSTSVFQTFTYLTSPRPSPIAASFVVLAPQTRSLRLLKTRLVDSRYWSQLVQQPCTAWLELM